MTKIKLQKIHKSFNIQHILRGVSVAAQKGDVIALFGSSGSGKSTLLRCINLLTTPDAGTVEIDQHIMCFDEQHKTQLNRLSITNLRKKIGMVFQQYNLWSHMSVLQNLIAAPIHVLKQPKKVAIHDANQLLAKVGLSSKKNCYPSQLSGGEQQRAAIARALMMKPEVMLFDEPTSALDPEMVGEVLMVMQQLAQDGMTMFIATHELNFARKVANKTIFLDEGKIVEEGETAALFTSPTSLRFRQFLEAMQY